MLQPTSIVVASNNQVSGNLDDEAVLLNIDSGVYYGIGDTGARIWQLIQQPRMIHEIHQTLVSEYDVEPEVCLRQLNVFLEHVAKEGLIQITNAQAL